ncbi:MAG TPA: phospho-sugar mutase [Bacillota bacterium]|nr:phospho-sugar mutase [Bacillota bacterium]
MDYKDKYQKWLASAMIDDGAKAELDSIRDDEKEIEDRFYKDLDFGTGGLRGIIGAGTNRVNIYTIGMATQGLANYIKKAGDDAVRKGVAIAYDSRRMSPEFALQSALVLCANGIKTYLFSELQPTPILSFAVRELGATAGIVVTASHNPPQYNGYKVYWDDGAQVTHPIDSDIIGEVNNIDDFSYIKTISKQEAEDRGLLVTIGEDILSKYLAEAKKLCFDKDLVSRLGSKLKVVFTPIHGAGNKPVRRLLAELGFTDVSVVPEQELPDSEFSTVEYPNPEEKAVFELAIKLAKKNDADVIIGTDPDCDRVGVVVKNKQGQYVTLSGNQTGAMLVHYCLSTLKNQGRLPDNACIIKTIVTSEMGRKIADSFDTATLDTLTGFKYIGERIKEFETSKEYSFIMGYEESYGYLAGDFVRDKDAVIASMLICEMAAYYKDKGMTLYEGLEDLWETYGYFNESLESIEMAGKEGMEKIQSIMNSLRDDCPVEIAGLKVTRAEDYLESKAIDFSTDTTEKIKLPVSNVLKFDLEDDSWFAIRPSGTEPKVKLYFSVVGSDSGSAQEQIDKLMEAVTDLID